MRTVIGVTAGIVIVFLGVLGISQQAQRVEPKTQTAAANTSYDTATGVFESVTHAGGESLIWFGVAAIVLVACGLLVVAASGGGR